MSLEYPIPPPLYRTRSTSISNYNVCGSPPGFPGMPPLLAGNSYAFHHPPGFERGAPMFYGLPVPPPVYCGEQPAVFPVRHPRRIVSTTALRKPPPHHPNPQQPAPIHSGNSSIPTSAKPPIILSRSVSCDNTETITRGGNTDQVISPPTTTLSDTVTISSSLVPSNGERPRQRSVWGSQDSVWSPMNHQTIRRRPLVKGARQRTNTEPNSAYGNGRAAIQGDANSPYRARSVTLCPSELLNSNRSGQDADLWSPWSCELAFISPLESRVC